MVALDVFYASAPAGEVPIATLTIHHPDFTVIRTCSGYEDQTLTNELGNAYVFTASGLDIALPARDTTGQQNLIFAIENVTGIAMNNIQTVLEDEDADPVKVDYRLWLASDKSAPAEPPLEMILVSADFTQVHAEMTCSYMDIINYAWPRDRYTAAFAPGIRYIAA